MKNYILILVATLMLSLTACGTIDTQDFDPVDTGEIIGFTYLMTKKELSEDDREKIEKAYAIFAEVANYPDEDGNVDVKALLFKLIDETDFGTDDAETEKVAVKIIINRYWRRVDAKYGIESRVPSEQLAIVRQIYIGIERGLGRGPM